MHQFHVGSFHGPSALPQWVAEGLYRLRYQVFHERLAWDVKVSEGLEVDEFDDPDAVYVVAVDEQARQVHAGWRLRPTTRPYMLKQTFPMLLQGREAPVRPGVWEISRFAVLKTPYAESANASYGRLSRELIAQTIQYAVLNGISSYVWVTSLGVERMTRRLGYRLERWGRPMMLGKVNCVVNQLAMNAHTVSLAASELGEIATLQEVA